MRQQANPSIAPLIPTQPVPPEAADFSAQVHELLDGNPKDEAVVSQSFHGMDEIINRIGAGLYSIASMLVGEGEQSIRLVEIAIATAKFVPGETPEEARLSGRRALAVAALQALAEREPGCLATPQSQPAGGGCIGDDDLDAAGVSRDELEQMLSGPDRGRVRLWLESLTVPMRVVFALRAVAGLHAEDIAALLKENCGPSATGWTADHVREISRQALCSLASQLLHASLS